MAGRLLSLTLLSLIGLGCSDNGPSPSNEMRVTETGVAIDGTKPGDQALGCDNWQNWTDGTTDQLTVCAKQCGSDPEGLLGARYYVTCLRNGSSVECTAQNADTHKIQNCLGTFLDNATACYQAWSSGCLTR